jgi:hypothetical protein
VRQPAKPRSDDFDDDEDDDDFLYFGGGGGSMVVIEMEPEPHVFQSSILGPDGQPIVYSFEPEKQDFIGFVSPDALEAIRIASQKPKRKRRRKHADPQ